MHNIIFENIFFPKRKTFILRVVNTEQKMNTPRIVAVVFVLIFCDRALVMPQYLDDFDQSYGECRTPDGQSGNCVPLTKCAPLLARLMKSPLTLADEKFLKRCQCGYIPGAPLVCCPPVLTSAGPSGRLIAYRNGRFDDDLPAPGRCGTYAVEEVSDAFIVGGRQSRIYESPWMALLKYTKPNNGIGFHCGGVLIHEYHVLTAAHCVSGNDLQRMDMSLTAVRFGEWDLNRTFDCEYGLCADRVVDAPIDTVHVHEMYKPTFQKKEHDIALIRLKKRIAFTEWIRPICLPVNDAIQDRDYAGAAMQVTGWGYTSTDASASTSNIKMKAVLYGVSQDRCVKKYRSKRVQLTANQMCAGGKMGIDSCRGDSGAPLMEYNESADVPHWTVVGIVSFGLTVCGQESWPGVYTRVDKYIPWILDAMHRST